MHEVLFEYIRQRSTTPLAQADLDLLRKVFVPKRLRRRQYFLQEGEICKYKGFIIKGAMRQYTVYDKGSEHIVNLFTENFWAADLESFCQQTPTIYNIDAWEETELLVVHRDDGPAVRAIPACMEMIVKHAQHLVISSQRRMLGYMSLSAEERYEEMLKNYPEFTNRFPLHVIAAYLGIAKETLSRIRNQSLKK